jgi:hypothetical protein
VLDMRDGAGARPLLADERRDQKQLATDRAD